MTGLLGGIIYVNTGENVNGVCVFEQDRINNVSIALFYAIMVMTIISILGAVMAFPSEIPIIARENHVYRVESYYLAKFISEIPAYLIIPSLHTLVIYFLVRFGCTSANFLMFWIVLVLISNSAYALGHVMSALGKSINMAISLAAPILSLQILFSGFFIKKA
jgi:hypothetical protein